MWNLQVYLYVEQTIVCMRVWVKGDPELNGNINCLEINFHIPNTRSLYGVVIGRSRLKACWRWQHINHEHYLPFLTGGNVESHAMASSYVPLHGIFVYLVVAINYLTSEIEREKTIRQRYFYRWLDAMIKVSLSLLWSPHAKQHLYSFLWALQYVLPLLNTSKLEQNGMYVYITLTS